MKVTTLRATMTLVTLASCSCSQERIIRSEPFAVESNTWVTIDVNKPLTPSANDQRILLSFLEPFADTGFGVSVAGSTVVPAVRLVDDRANEWPLTHIAYVWTGGQRYLAFTATGVAKNRRFKAVRLRADRRVEATRVIWQCVWAF